MCSKVVIIAIIVLMSPNLIQSVADPFCTAIVPDAATQLQNGTVAIFQGKNLWFVTLDSTGQTTALTGPCLIKDVFPQMDGPIDAAVTIDKHDSVTEFLGASIYFTNGSFYTFRNLRPYQVEWGDLIYLPVKGQQNKMGVNSDDAKKYMPTTISAAFFDPSTTKSKFIFPDGTVLGFTFELGSEFDKPVVTDLGTELKKYGITTLQNGVTAALTIMASQQLVFFKGQTYCQFSYAKGSSGADCLLKPSAEFFRCDSIKRTPGNCAAPSSLSSPIARDAQSSNVSVNSPQKGIVDVTNVRTGNETNSTTPNHPGKGGNGGVDSVYSLPIVHTLCQLTLNFLLFSFIKTLL